MAKSDNNVLNLSLWPTYCMQGVARQNRDQRGKESNLVNDF